MKLFGVQFPHIVSWLVPVTCGLSIAGCVGGPSSRAASRFYALTRETKASFGKGDYATARKDAQALQAEMGRFKENWNYGNAVHASNIVLGRLALRDGKVQDAKRYLLAAGATPGSPQLDSFGPNMALAEDLLKKGEKDVVLKYFAECTKFWDREFSEIGKWTADVKAGRSPEFGANLQY